MSRSGRRSMFTSNFAGIKNASRKACATVIEPEEFLSIHSESPQNYFKNLYTKTLSGPTHLN